MRDVIRGAITGSEPITTTEAKLQARVETTADDALLAVLIPAVRAAAEQFTRRALVAGSYTYAVRGNDKPVFRDALPLPCVPITALTSLAYVSASTGTTVALTTGDFVLRNYESFAFVVPVVGRNWPTDAEEVRVTYTCGYAAADVPVDIKLALLLSLVEWYSQREDVEQRTLAKASRALLAPWRVRWFE
jgi:uncharacterized phiE125 gp8 family phage protein